VTGKRKIVMIVDDTPNNLTVVGSVLTSAGYEVRFATSGEIALERIPKVQPDLILLDVMMPGLNGFETCCKLKEQEVTRDIPVIFMTALAETADKVRGFEAGAVDYVTKPIQTEELLARVNTHLRLRELTAHLEQLVRERTAALNAAYERLGRLDRAKSDFVAIASHELRTPLTILSGYIQMLMGDATLMSGSYAGMLHGAKTGAERLSAIVDAMVDLGRIEIGSIQSGMRIEMVNLGAVVNTIVYQFERALAERRLTLTIQGVSDLMIEADPELIQKALLNLIGNAIKYTPDDGKIVVAGRWVEAGDTSNKAVEIQVQDTGIGIDPAHRELIFEKFYQTGNVSFHSSGKTKFKGGGPGLGLPIARGIIQAHGGRLWVESPGCDEQSFPGSTFYVTLPARCPRSVQT
jgi:signal transduction histidine kinase